MTVCLKYIKKSGKGILDNLRLMISAILFILFIMSCTDETIRPDVGSEPETVELTLWVPDPTEIGFNSRASVDVSVNEAEFSNIYLAYTQLTRTNEDNRDESLSDEFHIVSLTKKETESGTNAGRLYKGYVLSLTPGNYRFYLIANFDHYLGSDNESNSLTSVVSSEKELKELILNYSSATPIVAGHLPMICMPEEMIKKETSSANDIIRVVKGTNNTITAPLTILCSKVRYTILFDARKGGFSETFGDERINFTFNDNEPPYATNVVSRFSQKGFEEVTSEYIDNPKFNWKRVTNPGVGTSNGWTVDYDGSDFSMDYGAAEFYDTYFDIYQEKTMEHGIYKLEVQGFYRNGAPWDNSYDILENHKNGSEELLANLYINNVESPLMSLYDVDYGNDKNSFYPNDMKGGADALNLNHFYTGNSVTYIHDGKGTVRFGIRKPQQKLGDWTLFTNFQLFYKSLEDNGEKIQWNLPLDRYIMNWDATTNPNYPLSASDDRLIKLTGMDFDEWDALPNKAWQGVAYLPENLMKGKDEKTVLHFPFSFNNYSQKIGEKEIILFDDNEDSKPKDDNNNSVNHGLQRAMMYDIVILVKNQASADLYVKVSDWDYNPIDKVW